MVSNHFSWLRAFTSFGLVIAVYFVSLPAAAAERELSLEQAKAHYTVEIVKQVVWPNDDELVEFRVALLGADPEMEQALRERASTKIRGKSMVVERLDNRNFDHQDYAIIFLSGRFSAYNAELFPKTQSTLIIVDGETANDEEMVSLVYIDQDLEISFNRANLSARDFVVSLGLLEFAGTKEDFSGQLRENNKHLTKLLQEVKIKEQQLSAIADELDQSDAKLLVLVAQINESELQIKNNKEGLIRQRVEIKAKQQELAAAEIEMAAAEKATGAAEQATDVAEQAMDAAEQAMVSLQAEITHSQLVLGQQQEQITDQAGVLTKKERTIDVQRNVLIVIFTVSGIFFILLYFLIRSSRLRKKAIEELAGVNAKLYELATTDGMTGLFNRRHFLETTERELCHQQRKECQAVMVMLDIDHFKTVNDTLGHAAGDVVIKCVADLLKLSSRAYDHVGRMGGEEYAMMLIDCNVESATEIAQRLCKEVSEQNIEHQHTNIKITISIGLSQVQLDDANIKQSLQRADKALYISKQGGRNRVTVFSA